MKIGVIYPQNELKGDPTAVRRIGLAVEELGFDHLLTYDHVLGRRMTVSLSSRARTRKRIPSTTPS
jgi:hypothetical protein